MCWGTKRYEMAHGPANDDLAGTKGQGKSRKKHPDSTLTAITPASQNPSTITRSQVTRIKVPRMI